MATVSGFIRKLPKAELHLHLEGTVEPATLLTLAERHPEPFAPPANSRYKDVSQIDLLAPGAIEKLYQYEDFVGFLAAFKTVSEQMRTPEDFELVTYKMLERLRAEGVLHAEVYVSAGIIQWRGQQFEPFFEAIEAGRKRGEQDFGVSLLWIVDAVRHFGTDAVKRVVEDTIRLRKKHESIAGIGIGGDEARGPAEQFRGIYSKAKENGLHLLAHAGESVGPESIWAALNIGAERIGHGLNAIADPDLVQELAERQVPIEINITSNLRTGCCRKIGDHPVRRYFDEGLMITLNSDDPPMFGSWLANEYQIAQDNFGFTDEHLRELARNSFEASFLPAEQKLKFLQTLDSAA
jgi:aminodeoxyfutalosine deaminase